jgi:hypothetical protein
MGCACSRAGSSGDLKSDFSNSNENLENNSSNNSSSKSNKKNRSFTNLFQRNNPQIKNKNGSNNSTKNSDSTTGFNLTNNTLINESNLLDIANGDKKHSSSSLQGKYSSSTNHLTVSLILKPSKTIILFFNNVKVILFKLYALSCDKIF